MPGLSALSKPHESGKTADSARDGYLFRARPLVESLYSYTSAVLDGAIKQVEPSITSSASVNL